MREHVAALSVALAALFLVPSSPASAQLTASGPFEATADASLLRVDIPALSPALLPQTNLDLARSVALADSDGDVDTVDTGAQRTGAFAGTTGTSALLGSPLSIQENRASAAPSEDSGEVLLQVPANPLLDLDVVSTRALANWVSDTRCVAATEPLSLADQFAADATAVSPEAGQSVVDIDPGDDGAADSEAATGLPATGGPLDQRAVTATVSTRLAGATVLDGFAGDDGLVTVEVVRAPSYTASATGLPGGASVVGDDPIVDVRIGGQDVIRLEAGEIEEEPLVGLTLGDLLDGLDPALQPLSPVVRLSIPVTRSVDPNGLTASVRAALLRIELLPPPTIGTAPLGVIELAPVSASVVAPAGGITCGGAEDDNPMELQKLHSGPAVLGGTFDYTIAVGNVGDCTLTGVRVEDVLTGPVGSTIVSTTPNATVEPIADGFRITWADVGPIAPDGRVVLRIRVSVPDTARPGQRYHDAVTSTGTCDGREVQRRTELPEPEVEPRGVGPCDVRGSAKSSSHEEVYRGEQFAYFVHVFNSGAQPCTGVAVTDTLVDGVTFVSCSDTCVNDGQVVRWQLGTLAAGHSVTLSVVVQVDPDATGRLPNLATIDTSETPPHDVSTPGPRVTDISVIGVNTPARSPGVAVLARTGGPGAVAWPIAVALGLAALALRRVTAPKRL